MIGIFALPVEIVTKIAWLCSFASQAAFARTCRHLHTMLNQNLYERDIAANTRFDSCMLWAAERGQLDTLKTAIHYGAGINLRAAHGDDDDYDDEMEGLFPSYASPLHVAIQGGHVDIIDYLLQHGADLNAPSLDFCNCSSGGYTDACPLHMAMVHCPKSIEVMQLLISHGAYLLNPATPVLHGVAKLPHLHHLIEPLLEWSKTTDVDFVRLTDDYGATALKYLCSSNHEAPPALIDALLNAGAPKDAVSEGRTILYHAMAANNINAALTLLCRGADPLIPCSDEWGMSLLLVCLTHSQDLDAGQRMLYRLLTAGADINALSSGKAPPYGPPLFFAAYDFANIKVVEVLLHAGAMVKGAVVLDQYFGDEPLEPVPLVAALLRHLWVYLDEWPNINMPGPTADDIICHFQLLLRHGASLDPVADEESALKIASDLFPPALLRGLLESATAENISLQHVKQVIEAIHQDGMQAISTRRGKIWGKGLRHGEVSVYINLLGDFLERAFAGSEY